MSSWIDKTYSEHKEYIPEALNWPLFGLCIAVWMEPHKLLLYVVLGIPLLTAILAKAIKWQREKGSDRNLV